jgi:hypothetical protein
VCVSAVLFIISTVSVSVLLQLLSPVAICGPGDLWALYAGISKKPGAVHKVGSLLGGYRSMEAVGCGKTGVWNTDVQHQRQAMTYLNGGIPPPGRLGTDRPLHLYTV